MTLSGDPWNVVPPRDPNPERRVLEQLNTWQALLTANVADGRQALGEVLDGPMQFCTWRETVSIFRGNDVSGNLVAGLAGFSASMFAPLTRRGCVPQMADRKAWG